MSFDAACSLIETILAGDARQHLVEELSGSRDFGGALLQLRDSMRSHAWKIGSKHVALGRFVKTFDADTRREGFHVLNDWDGKADRVNDDIIPVDVLTYVASLRGNDPPDAAALAILIDYYFVNLLALLSLRIWDADDVDANLDRLNGLLHALQGPAGSGQLFAASAETLILIATSHFEAVEVGYDKLLARVRTLNHDHQLGVAIGHAVSMGSHLRFGFEATYGRDTVVMRDDNVADYPWLCYALVTVMREYAAQRDGRSPDRLHNLWRPASAVLRQAQDGPEHRRTAGPEVRLQADTTSVLKPTDEDRLIEALVNGLSSDPRAFIGEAPRSLSAAEADRSAFADLFNGYRSELLQEFEQYRPADDRYSPLSFFFNFSHNVLKGTVVDALLRGAPWAVSFDNLLTMFPQEPPVSQLKMSLATTVMGYARRNPDRIRGRLMPVIVYDPATGREAFTAAMRKLRIV